MNRLSAVFLKMLIAVIILICAGYCIVYFYPGSLDSLTDFGKTHILKADASSVMSHTVEQKEPQTINNPQTHNLSIEVIPEINQQNTAKLGEYALCLEAFSALNSISLKFVADKLCENEIMQLKAFNICPVIVSILDEIAGACHVEVKDLIENQMLSKMLQVKKVSDQPSYRKLRFLAKMDKLKMYFYSEDFIKLCRQ